MKQRTNKVGFRCLMLVLLTLVVTAILTATPRVARSSAQRQSRTVKTSHSERLNTAAREMVDVASEMVCKERLTDPKGSVPIDDMQSRPSLPVDSPAAVAGAERAQRLLPAAQRLVLAALGQLSREYKLRGRRGYDARLQRAIARVEAVQNVRPDVDSRDNASVLMKNPRTIIFGTIFLAGLPSDEGIISVLSHELVHIADGSQDNLTLLFRTVALRASSATGLRIRDQRGEELACDLVGAMATRAYVAETPTYETLPQRISRALEHNCVETDEGDEDHLSPRDTIRAILFLKPSFSRELVYGR